MCVEKCPDDNFSPWLESQIPVSDLAESLVDGDTKTKMKPYCTSDTTEEIFDRYAHVCLPNINTWVFGLPYLFVI